MNMNSRNLPKFLWPLAFALAAIGLVVLLVTCQGCAAERQELVRYAAESAVNAAVDRFADKVEPDSPIEEILAMLAGTLAIVGHRWWGWRKGKYVKGKI